MKVVGSQKIEKFYWKKPLQNLLFKKKDFSLFLDH